MNSRNIASGIKTHVASVTLAPGATANVIVKIKVRNGKKIRAKRIINAVVAAISKVDSSKTGSAKARFVLKAGRK